MAVKYLLCMYIYIQMEKYVFVCIHTICVYNHTKPYIHKRVCMKYVFGYTNVCECTSIYLNACIHFCVYIYTNTYFMYTFVFTHKYLYSFNNFLYL